MLMAESQIAESEINEPPVSEAQPSQESTIVSDSWQQTVQAVLGVVMLLGAFAMVHYYSPKATLAEPPNDLQKQVHELTAQIEQLKQDQAMPAIVLNRYRNSVATSSGSIREAFRNHGPTGGA